MRKTKLSKKQTIGGCCGVIVAIFVIALVASLFSSHNNASSSADDLNATATSQAVAQQWNVNFAATQDAETQVAALPTHTPTPKPTVKATPNPTPRPTQQPTARPTPKPTQQTCQGVNNNPWCYSFSGSKLIYYPPSNFCSYFNCISSFWGADDPGDGYVVQCADGTFSQSGGESGACSYHGGVMRPLYSH